MIAAPPPDYVVKHQKDMWKIRLIGAGIVLVGLLIVIVPLGWDLYVESWPTVDGSVTNSRVSAKSDNKGYTIYINYDYQVDGQKYSGSDSRTTTGYGRPSELSKGSRVTVRYNPALPAFSKLVSSISLSGVLMGVCCVFPFGLLFLAISFLPARKPPELGRMVKIN